MQLIRLTRVDIDKIRAFDEKHAPPEPIYHIDTVKELHSFFDNESFVCYGIYLNDKLVGHTSFVMDKEDSYYLNAIIIDKNYRQQGLASEVLQKVLDEVKGKGGKEIFLTVSPLNKEAIAFYDKFGFETYDSKKNVYGPGLDRLYMKLEI